jgi:gluconate kinase
MPEPTDGEILELIQKAAVEAQNAKQRMTECIALANQLRDCMKTPEGEMPKSFLTKKPMTTTMRNMILAECMQAADRLKLR